MIRTNREIYLKHIVTNLEAFKEPSLAYFPVLGHYSYDSNFGNFASLSPDVPLTQKSEMTFQVNLLESIEESIFCQDPLSGATYKEDEGEKITRHEEVTKFFSLVWTLYFDVSKSQ
jgi:hypothetical protein